MLRIFQLLAFAAISVLGAHANHQEDTTCSIGADGTCASPRAAALLQKGFQRDEKGSLAQKQFPRSDENLYGTTCTGTQAQGRCWFLSEIGESCAKTCANQGLSFSFVIADPNEPVMPRLVGHEPKVKQSPWAALECFVPSEDRFHTANENAARHYVSDVGDWSHESCKLACPCGGVASNKCSWKPAPACAPAFMYRGVEYLGCATVDPDHERPWCQHSFQHTNKGVERDWSYCTHSCEGELPQPEIPKKECGWIPAAGCVKEFEFEGAHYVGCTGTDHDAPWCSNTDPYKGSWSHCTYSCPNEERQLPRLPSNDKLCTWQQSSACSKTFEYKGKDYTGCIDEDHPTPWCSLNRVHEGAWETCAKVCTEPRREIPPPQPAIRRMPCDRDSTVDDSIGSGVMLDEAGYKIVAVTHSSANMKRFICRIVDNMACAVTDDSAMMSFIAYYDERGSESYDWLESELTSLCRASGKWVAPINRYRS